MTKASNPCAGISGYRETGRETVVSEDQMSLIMAHAPIDLQFALRLTNLAGQRVTDGRLMSESHISGDLLHLRQGKGKGKGKTKLRIEIIGELKQLIEEIHAFKSTFTVRALPLLVNESGRPMIVSMLRTRFDNARKSAGIVEVEFQFRDLRATAATTVDDVSGIKSAQPLLGHTTGAMTADYIRHKVGKKVGPVR